MRKALFTTTAVILAGLALPAQAQVTQGHENQAEAGLPPSDPAAAAAETQGFGADIVVTAQRREENLQRAALAVCAVSGDALTKGSITQATDLTRLLPAIQITPAASFTQIYLRGVGTFGANAFAEQGVAFNLDGVYLSRPAAPAGLFYDLGQARPRAGCFAKRLSISSDDANPKNHYLIFL